MGGIRGWVVTAAALAVALVASGCDGGEDAPVMPASDAVQSLYGEAVEVEISGNLVRLQVPMPDGFERGGTLWARSGPYFYLFTTATRDLFVDYPDMAAVEVVANTTEGEEVARSRLLRSTLNAITWPHAIAYASQAQTEGTESPRFVERLVRHGEERTEYEYNPEFVPRPSSP